MSIVLLVFQMLSLLFQVNKYQVIVHFSRRLFVIAHQFTDSAVTGSNDESVIAAYTAIRRRCQFYCRMCSRSYLTDLACRLGKDIF